MKNQAIKWKLGACLKAKRFWAVFLSISMALLVLEGKHYRPRSWADVLTSQEEKKGERETPFVVDEKTGKTWKIFGLEIVGKVMSEQTKGKYAVVISTIPPEGGPPAHVHEHEDEMFYVLSGIYEFRFENKRVRATPGDIIHLPRNIPHSFTNIGSEPGVMMNTITPGGFEQFFAEIDRLPKDEPLEQEEVEEIASQYGLQFVPEPN